MILLDTNVLSEVWRADGLPDVKRRVEDAWPEIHLSVIVMGEVLSGIRRLPAGRRRATLEAFYVAARDRHRARILPVDMAVGEAWGALSARLRRIGRPVPAPDGLIAATALAHDLELWTRNVRDFADTGARLFNPWEP